MSTMEVARIDEEISRLEKALLKPAPNPYYAKRNSLFPVSRLPARALALVFVHCARDSYYKEATESLTVRTPTWRWNNISYVCRHWRDIALDCPTFWSYVSVTSTHSQCWIEELLARSNGVSLKVHLKASGGFGEALRLVAPVASHLDRMQEFRVFLPRASRRFFAKLSLPAPRLQHLDIAVGETSLASHSPTILFRGDTPALRKLRLSNCPVAWHLLNFSNLTTLSVRYSFPGCEQSVAVFLAVLRCMPKIMYMCLEGALASARGSFSNWLINATPRINLPCLARCMIAAPLSTVVACLSCMGIPPTAQLNLECRVEDGSSPKDDVRAVSSLLLQRFNAFGDPELALPTIRSLVVCSDPSGVWAILSTNPREHDPASLVEGELRDNIFVKFGITCRGPMTLHDMDHVLSDICCSVPSAHVHSLHAVGPPRQLDFWKKTLGHLHGLRLMELVEGDMPPIDSVLSIPTPGVENQTLLPALEKLVMHDLEFDDCPLEPDVRELPPPCIRPLVDALASRKNFRCKLIATACQTVHGDYQWSLEGQWKGGRFKVPFFTD